MADPEVHAESDNTTRNAEAAGPAEIAATETAHFTDTLPLIELENAADYSSYLLHSSSEILSVLRTLIQKGALITVYFDQGRAFLLTSLIDLYPDRNELVFDLGSNTEMNQRALAADRLIFTTQIDKVKIQFRLGKLSPTQFEGRSAFRGEMPDALLRLQRREYFRLSTPIASPVQIAVALQRDDGSRLSAELPLFDISGGGVGLMAPPDLSALFRRGEVLRECRINLPNEGLVSATVCVRNAFDVTARSGAHHVRVGCEFVDLPAARLSMVQRYITRVERERKARLNGLA